ncbi:MAG: dihydrofolate reductase family protein [Candidatus Woesebacteria bacterium]|jgi:dihydrofolate reductase
MNVFIIAAISADGFIAQDKEQSSLNWTTKADTKFFVERTKKAAVVVMGRKTYQTIKPKYRPFKNRLNIVYSRDDSWLRDDEKLFLEQTVKEGWLAQPTQFYVTQDNPKNLISSLKKKNIKEVAICGGVSIYTKFMQAGVVNKIYLTVEPVLFGSGLKLFNQSLSPAALLGSATTATATAKNKDFQALQLVAVKKLGDEGAVLLEYDVKGA